jgi:hypothetical protein
MISEGLVIALTAGVVALINGIPAWRMSDKIKNILKKVVILERHMIAVEDVGKIKEKFLGIQTFYVQKIMDEQFRAVAILKSDTFTKLICDYVLALDFDDLNDYSGFHNHLCSASKFNRQRMFEVLGEEVTNKYYSIHLKHLSIFDAIIQKIFFTNGNSKKTKIITAAIDFFQLFMTELVNLSMNPNIELDLAKSRRIDDVILPKVDDVILSKVVGVLKN